MTIFEVVLPNGDRAEAESLSSLAFATYHLIDEAVRAGASSAWLRRGLFVTQNGNYNGFATAKFGGGR